MAVKQRQLGWWSVLVRRRRPKISLLLCVWGILWSSQQQQEWSLSLFVVPTTSMTTRLAVNGLVGSFAKKATFCQGRFPERSRKLWSSIDNDENHHPQRLAPRKNVAIVGGGLAGLSTAFHLLQKSPFSNITIIDSSARPGEGGASSVAAIFAATPNGAYQANTKSLGINAVTTNVSQVCSHHCCFGRIFLRYQSLCRPKSLLHPLSPRGKLVYMGLEGLACTNRLIDAAKKFESNTILRPHLFRVATNEEHVTTLQETAKNLPQLATWMDDPVPMPSSSSDQVPHHGDWKSIHDKEKNILGAIRLHSGCKVVHMPSYLRGLWSACQSIGTGEKQWIHDPDCSSIRYAWKDRLADFDCVVFAAGAGMFQASIVTKNDDFPTQLVRGQSIEMTTDDDNDQFENALLCGKYISPMLEKNRVLVGATHEFKAEPLDEHQVKDELKERSYAFASSLWDKWRIDRITKGYRVQSNRGKHGRLPIIGRWETPYHPDSWIFTGLSSRGLLYHGVFGDALAAKVLGDFEEEDFNDFDWWRK